MRLIVAFLQGVFSARASFGQSEGDRQLVGAMTIVTGFRFGRSRVAQRPSMTIQREPS